MNLDKMGYSHVHGLICGVVLILWIGVQQGSCIRCFSCDVTSSASYADANEECNGEGIQECVNTEDSACMLEGFLKETNAIRIIKRCMRGCPLYINTTAEVVRCCIEDGCNAKFEPVPARRPSLRQAPRGFNERERGGYNVPMQGTNRPYNQNNIDIKRLDQGPNGGRFQPPVEANELDLEKDMSPQPTNLPGTPPSATGKNEVIPKGKDTKFHPRGEKGGPGMKKFGDKKMMNHDRNSALAEQKLKKNDSANLNANGANTVLPPCGLIMITMISAWYHL